jgi:hypothetical protein
MVLRNILKKMLEVGIKGMIMIASEFTVLRAGTINAQSGFDRG